MFESGIARKLFLEVSGTHAKYVYEKVRSQPQVMPHRRERRKKRHRTRLRQRDTVANFLRLTKKKTSV